MIWMWSGFVALVLALLALDHYAFQRRTHVVGMKEALLESLLWVALGVAFSGFIYVAYDHHWHGLGVRGPHHRHTITGGHAAVLYITGYVIEESLSVDNLFVMAVIFGYFRIPPQFQHRVLFWGILGAQVMRGGMIGVGAALLARFDWIFYLFGAFLIYTAWRMIRAHTDPDPKNNPLIKLARRLFPVTPELHGPHFFVREPVPFVHIATRASHEMSRSVSQPAGGQGAGRVTFQERASLATDLSLTATSPLRYRWVLTPLALALLVVETTDLLFAVDSIPATFGVTTDPFLVFTSNIFAVLGLRAMYFALAGVLKKFKYLSVSLALILALVGAKMLAKKWLLQMQFHHLSYWTLAAVALILAGGVAASVWAAEADQPSPRQS